MTKQEQINALIAKPIQLGDKVNVRIPYEKLTSVKVGRKYKTEQVSSVKNGSGKVVDVIDDEKHGKIYVVESSSSWSVPHEAQVELTKKK